VIRVFQLADHIRYYRKKMGLTQEELARKLNVSRPMLSKWENGTSVPDLEAVVKLSELFGVSIDRLLGKEEAKGDMLLELKEHYHLDEETDKALLEVIRYLTVRKEMKRVLFQLTQLSPGKRKAVEKIMTVIVDKMAKI